MLRPRTVLGVPLIVRPLRPAAAVVGVSSVFGTPPQIVVPIVANLFGPGDHIVLVPILQPQCANYFWRSLEIGRGNCGSLGVRPANWATMTMITVNTRATGMPRQQPAKPPAIAAMIPPEMPRATCLITKPVKKGNAPAKQAGQHDTDKEPCRFRIVLRLKLGPQHDDSGFANSRFSTLESQIVVREFLRIRLVQQRVSVLVGQRNCARVVSNYDQ